jgi:hypothetical protein
MRIAKLAFRASFLFPIIINKTRHTVFFICGRPHFFFYTKTKVGNLEMPKFSFFFKFRDKKFQNLNLKSREFEKYYF